ncbi:DUF383-domain-containing protein [Gonapodya prolifera JEL478]|uniref:Protein HGH1 homolog n=1 Tax=Gonapodya prolifera (strain JEL478) TaxID=1344416 RepID=A0A139AE68_GONPJ|nr:DUF383-domain-containing protein [Gonapodya prolifera JEL478]|eukprot:KXS14969.1 DUF383-domain-containing protein [Gonapodya prolifera JEL478]
MEEQLEELFPFLRDPKQEVRKLAVEHVLSFSTSQQFIPVFEKSKKTVVRDLKKLLTDAPLVAHDALKSLINLSLNAPILTELRDESYLITLVTLTVVPTSVLADLACMALSNATKGSEIAAMLVKGRKKGGKTTSHVAALVDVFVKGEGKKYNLKAEFNFLANVFANVTVTSEGRALFLAEPPTQQGTETPVPLLADLAPFVEHPDIIRRGGVISTIKNCLFDISSHPSLLSPSGPYNLIPRLLLPLAGPEDLSEDPQSLDLPPELQLLEPTKAREPDPVLRRMLVECLLLLATTREGRDVMRGCATYLVIREAHMVETVEAVSEEMEKVVDFLMRDEEDEGDGGRGKGAQD